MSLMFLAKSTMDHFMCCKLCFSSSASSSHVNTLCSAVTEGTRAVGNDSGREPMCINNREGRGHIETRRNASLLCECERSAKNWSTGDRHDPRFEQLAV